MKLSHSAGMFVTFLMLASMLAMAVTPSAGASSQSNQPEYEPGQLLVQYRDSASDAQIADLKAKYNAAKLDRVRAKGAGKGELELVSVSGGDMIALAAQLSKEAAVEFAEPNWHVTHSATTPPPNDPYYTNSSLWGMYGATTTPTNQYGSNAAAAWATGKTGLDTVYVGIIDEGINCDHPDLVGQCWTNQKDLADGIDNDGNGYIDDIHGWDFVNNDNTVYDGGSDISLDNHATHVAGTIGGKANNNQGVVGVNWNIKLISAKFLGAGGGSIANAVKAVDYLTDLKTRHGLNIVASNNSWGGGGYSSALFASIQKADAANILFIAAAGNSGTNNDKRASYPSGYNVANVIAVAAIDKTGALASFSQYGRNTVDLGAPGVDIWSSVNNTTSKYASYNGTSMATPHVTGAAALYASTHPGANAAAIKNAVLVSAVPTASLSGKTVTGGRLDVNAALVK